MASLLCSAKMTALLYKKEADVAVSRGTMGIAEAEKAIRKALDDESKVIAEKTFDDLTKQLYDNNIALSDEESNAIYKKGFFNRMKLKIDSSDAGIIPYLRKSIPAVPTGEIYMDDADAPSIDFEGDSVFIRDINVKYAYKDIYERNSSFDVKIDIPDIILYDGNDDIFSYSLIAGKGIYITGKTSTFMGDIFAGKHGPEEMRKPEALYAERERYGGLNIMATQAAFYGKKIVSEADINLRGSFVLVGDENEPMDIYTCGINEMDNVAAKNVFGHVGNTFDYMEGQTEKKLVDEATEVFDEIAFYYDSNNDRYYNGTYRKIISAADVTLKNDITGIVIAFGNVIVEEGVNVEGLIICKDRIYIQGNNNIVSSKEVLNTIIKEELSGNMYTNTAEDDDETGGISDMHLDVVDYLGGMNFRGIFYQ